MVSQRSASFTSRSSCESVLTLGEWFTCREESLSIPFLDHLSRSWFLQAQLEVLGETSPSSAPPFVASAKEAGCSDSQDHRTLPQRSLQCIGWWEQIRQPDSIAIVSLKARLTWGTFGIQNLSSYAGGQRPPRLDLAGQKCKCLTPSARSYPPQCLCIPHSVFHHLSTLLSQVSCSGVDHGFANPRR